MELAFPEKGRHRALKSSEIRKLGGMQPPNPAVQYNEDEDAGKNKAEGNSAHPAWPGASWQEAPKGQGEN